MYYNAGRSIYLCASDANTSYIDFKCIDTITAGPYVKIQASDSIAGCTLSSILGFYGSAFYFNGDGSALTHNFTCGALTCRSLNCSSLTLGAPTFTGSTPVNHTSSTLPTSGAHIGFLFKATPLYLITKVLFLQLFEHSL